MAFGDEDLDQLEDAIRRLQIEWDKFFSGVEKKPPNELKTRVEGLVRRYAYADYSTNAERFRSQTLTARYNTFSELWAKRLRAREEGRPLGVHGLKADILPPPKATAPSDPTPNRAGTPARDSSASIRIGRPDDDRAVRALYEQFVAARQTTGESAAVRFESFQKLIAQQAHRILAEKGAAAVDFRLETKDGKVSLKAKPVR